MVYTKIHDKYYDLSGFAHPGGMVAISLAQGRDATELFEMHHQFSDRSIIESFMRKYEVSERSPIASNNLYDWKKTMNSEFTKDLKDMATSVLGADIKASNLRILEYIVLCILLLSQFLLFVKGYWISVLTYPIVLWIFSANIFHDGAHFAVSKYWRLNSIAIEAGFNLATPYHWYHEHNIGHHSFPNILGRDPDLYHVPDMLRHSCDKELFPIHRYQHYLFLLVSAIGIPATYLLGGAALCLLGLPYNGVVSLSRTRYLNPYSIPVRLVVYFVLMHGLPILLHGISIKGFVFSLVPEIVYTAAFTVCSQVNHLTPENTDRFDSNFFIHQVITSQNVNTRDYWTTIFTGGLNMQIEHHLFPSVNHCHLRKLVPHVKAICEKHGVHYSESTSLYAALVKHVSHLYDKGYLSDQQRDFPEKLKWEKSD